MTITPDPSWAAFYAHLEESLGHVHAHCAIEDLEAAEDATWGERQRRRMPGHPQSHQQVGHRSLWGAPSRQFCSSTDADSGSRTPCIRLWVRLRAPICLGRTLAQKGMGPSMQKLLWPVPRDTMLSPCTLPVCALCFPA